MSVFISYSSIDKVFVERLALMLVDKRIRIWLDQWELQAGDSLLDKIQNALTDSSYLLVVLSKYSVESEWCKKELNAGLMREIEEKKVHLIPILIDDCKIPVFLREKMYADFRSDFTSGFNSLVRSLSKLISENMGNDESDDFVTDFALHWGLEDELYFFDIDMVSWHKKEKKSILLQLRFVGNKKATEKYFTYEKMGMPYLMKEVILEMINSHDQMRKKRMLVKTNLLFHETMTLGELIGLQFDMTIRAVQMGIDNNNDILLNLSDYLDMLYRDRDERVRTDKIAFGKKS